MTITVCKPDRLISQYQNDIRPQRVFLELDPEEERLVVAVDDEMSQYSTNLYWEIPPLRVTVATSLMDRIEPLAERIVAGAAKEWDGRNYALKLTEDAQEASEEIEAVISEYGHDAEELGVVLDSVFLYEGCGWEGITGLMSDAQVEAQVNADVAEAMSQYGWAEEDVDVDSALLDQALAERDRLRDDLRKQQVKDALDMIQFAEEDVRLSAEDDEHRAELLAGYDYSNPDFNEKGVFVYYTEEGGWAAELMDLSDELRNPWTTVTL